MTGVVRHLLRAAAAMPPHLVLIKGGKRLARIGVAALESHLARRRCSYPRPGEGGGRLVWRLSAPVIAATDPAVARAASLFAERRFDLLGSGWGPVLWERPGREIAAQCWPADQQRVQAILGLIDDPAYRFIDWAMDFKSGYRWNHRVRGPASPYGHKPGVDIKVPWELARCRHFLAQAQVFAQTGDDRIARDIRNQILDFAASNPPGWGVNWACAMDVAIRIATQLIAVDMLRQSGWSPDAPFERELADQALAHGRFIFGHLEGGSPHRGNHYLADLCGLVFAGLYLAPTDETRRWLDFALPELDREICRQFTPDGANFEASVAYHRLSAELAVYTVALASGAKAHAFSPVALERLLGAGRFAQAVTMPSGRAVQIGDNDSGRFIAPALGADLERGLPVIRHLDFAGLIAAIAQMFDREWDTPAWTDVDRAMIRSLLGGVSVSAPLSSLPPLAPSVAAAVPVGMASTLTRVVLPIPEDEYQSFAFTDFGLYIWKSPRCFVAMRCGPIGQAGNGGHAHNDQLAVEIEIDGVPWAQDPGTHVYTPDLAERDRYRSVQAHFAPRSGMDEPARMLMPFRLEDRAEARMTAFGPTRMAGVHIGFGVPVMRRVERRAGELVVEDAWGGSEIGPMTQVVEYRPQSPADLAETWGLRVPYSPGYGIVRP